MPWLDVVVLSLSVVSSSAQWLFFTTAYLVLTSLQLVAWPTAALWKVLLFVLAPVIYTVR